jgi:hypothetical protein
MPDLRDVERIIAGLPDVTEGLCHDDRTWFVAGTRGPTRPRRRRPARGGSRDRLDAFVAPVVCARSTPSG